MAEAIQTSNPWEIEQEVQEFVKKESFFRGARAAIATSAFALTSAAAGLGVVASSEASLLSGFLGMFCLGGLECFCARWAYHDFKRFLKLDALDHSLKEGLAYVRNGGGQGKLRLRRITNKQGFVRDLKFRTDSVELAKSLGDYRKKDLEALKIFLVVIGVQAAMMGAQLPLSPNVQKWLEQPHPPITQSVE